MTKVTAALLKELRERTGVGIMECKLALEASNGDIELAIATMQQAGQAKAAKKMGRVAAQGVVLMRTNTERQRGILMEINCETDFVAKEKSFQEFADRVAQFALENPQLGLQKVKEHFEEERIQYVVKIGENITIRRIHVMEGDQIGGYQHGTRLAGLVLGIGASAPGILKNVAMHVVASVPEYLSPTAVPPEALEKLRVSERERLVEVDLQGADPEKYLDDLLVKFAEDRSLLSQPFVMNTRQTVEEYVKQQGTRIDTFLRWELGEGIERVTSDFASEVAAMMNSQ